jgi:hypothetical protein
MQKIPTIFDRDWNGDRSRVVDVPHKDCMWVFAGEGIPTRKLDGACCMVRDGKLYKRRELKRGQTAPPAFEPVNTDDETGKTVGWVPVGDGPDDKWFRAAFADASAQAEACSGHSLPDGTYEAVGPHHQGGIERDFATDTLANHNAAPLWLDGPSDRTFGGIRDWMVGRDIEGVVFHHTDGRMAKIKLRDFGLKRGPS